MLQLDIVHTHHPTNVWRQITQSQHAHRTYTNIWFLMSLGLVPHYFLSLVLPSNSLVLIFYLPIMVFSFSTSRKWFFVGFSHCLCPSVRIFKLKFVSPLSTRITCLPTTNEPLPISFYRREPPIATVNSFTPSYPDGCSITLLVRLFTTALQRSKKSPTLSKKLFVFLSVNMPCSTSLDSIWEHLFVYDNIVVLSLAVPSCDCWFEGPKSSSATAISESPTISRSLLFQIGPLFRFSTKTGSYTLFLLDSSSSSWLMLSDSVHSLCR